MSTTPQSRDLRAELIRFHLGDPTSTKPARPPLPASIVPFALHAARGVPVAAGWPLVVDLADPSDGFATSLGERDRGALAPSADLVESGPWAAFQVAELCARRRLRFARARFGEAAARLAATAAALLEADRARRPTGLPPEERADQLGALGARLVDPGRLAEIASLRKGGDPLPAERRRRLEAASDLLRGFEPAAGDPVWVVAHDERLTVGPATIVRADDPCARAAASFDEAAREAARLIGAARLVRLEAEGRFDPERHAPALERLDWRSFSAEELALVTPVFALVDPTDLVARGLASLSHLLLSGRPVAVVVPLDCAPADLDPAAPHFEPAMLGLGHRETFVHQGSIAEPLLVAEGFAQALAGGRPSLHVVDRPWFEVDGLDLAAVAQARVASRAVPLLRHEPEAGASWSRRLALDGNPEPRADWGRLPGEIDPSGTPFTFADAALLDPAWRAQFAVADPPPGGEAGETGDLEPLADWLALPAERRAQTLPFVVAADAEGRRVRLVVTFALAHAAADRLAFWRSLQELAGVRSEAVERAVADALRDAALRDEATLAELRRRHAEELDRARAGAAAAAVDRIVSTLLSPARPSDAAGSS